MLGLRGSKLSISDVLSLLRVRLNYQPGLESLQLGEPLGNEMQPQTTLAAAMTSEGLRVVEAGEPRASSADC